MNPERLSAGVRPSVLADLLARVEGATGPDCALSFAMAKALLVPNYDGDEWSWFGGKEHYTSSLGSALSLAERVLPGWHVRITSCGAPWSQWRVTLTGDYDFVSGLHRTSLTGRNAPTPALALLAAMLKALEAQQATPQAEEARSRDEDNPNG